MRSRVRRRALSILQRALRRRGYRLVRASGRSGTDGSWASILVDASTPLPANAENILKPDNPRLTDLKNTYDGLDWPVCAHSRWQASNFEGWLDLRYFRGDNSYVWHYREEPRASTLKFFLFLKYVMDHDHLRLFSKLDEDGAFGCFTYEFPGYPKCSRDLLDSISELNFLGQHIGLGSSAGLRIIDVGAGYGRLAYRAASALDVLRDYCCVDAVAESTFLCDYYLRFRGVVPPVRVVPLHEVRSLNPCDFDLAVNVHTFSECSLAAIEWWMSQLARLQVPSLFLVPNEPSGFLSLEVDGSRRDYLPVIEDSGYHLKIEEPRFTDPSVSALLGVHDRYYLFERA